MSHQFDIAIIGAGSAGLSALKEIKKVTNNFVIINGGPWGTTCARVGCMPSKALIQSANDFYRRLQFEELGIENASHLTVNLSKVMERVRSLRDRFVSGVVQSTQNLSEKQKISGYAQFLDKNTLQIENNLKISADKFIIATGSSPIIPKPWVEFKDDLITTDSLFEIQQWPSSLGVIGTGVIGLEIGQALSRLGLTVYAVNGLEWIGGLSDPVINTYAIEIFKREMNLNLPLMAQLQKRNSTLELSLPNGNQQIDKAIVSIGRSPNLKNLGLENLNLSLDKNGIPKFNPLTMQIEGTNLYIAGDVNGERPILHEASDEGRIAGYNALRETPQPFKRRTPLSITFTDPNIATVGRRYSDLIDKEEFVIGEAEFKKQGRALTMNKNVGLIRIYAHPKSGILFGAEMILPSGEHIAHLLAWAIQKRLTVFDMLSLPFYHPVIEEGLRTALRDVSGKVTEKRPDTELYRCEGHPADCLN